MIFTILDALQWAGCATGVAGALLLALNTKHSGWGFVLFLISNGFWTAYGIQTNAPGLITTQVIFTATSLLGIYRWLGFVPFRYTQLRQNPPKKHLKENDGLGRH